MLAGIARFWPLLAVLWAAAVGAQTLTPGGNHGYQDFVARDIARGSLIDMRNSDFRVANSRTSSPDGMADCETGPLPVNPYPVRIYDSPAVVLLGGRFDGEVPQGSDWLHTYCNSAAVGLWDSPHGSIEGLRARRVWDGLRLAGESAFFSINRVWLSEVRDDCIENDFLLAGMVRDSLLDGCFAGISMRAPPDSTRDGAAATVTLAGVLMRLQPYPYKGAMKQGFPVKGSAAAPALAIHDSVIAMGGADMLNQSRLTDALYKITECRNNLFLWTADDPWPEVLAKPPPCFRVLQGEAARNAWQSARQNWIDCHAGTARFADDTAADPARCDRTAHGGRY